VAGARDVLASPAGVHVYVVALVAILPLLAVMLIEQLRRWSSHSAPASEQYTEDEFLGVTWHWKYDSEGTLSARSLRAYCPVCPKQLVPRRSKDDERQTVQLDCDDHGVVAEEWGHWEALQDRVAREMDKRGRSDEWRDGPAARRGTVA
jgi:hypothetical protein